MARAMPDVPPALGQQLQMPNMYTQQQQQMQQLSAMMATLAMAGNTSNPPSTHSIGGGGGAFCGTTAFPPALGLTGPAPFMSDHKASAPQLPGSGMLDPVTAYMINYLQQVCADPAGVAGAAAAPTATTSMGFPSTTFPAAALMQAAAPPVPSNNLVAALAAGGPGGMHVIKVSVEGMGYQYQLTDDDLKKVFSRYGAVQNIRVDEHGSAAEISFAQKNQAQAAMNDLNGKALSGLNGTLRITWITFPNVLGGQSGSTVPAAAAQAPSYSGMPRSLAGGSWNFPPMPGWPQAPAATPAHAVSAGASMHGLGVDYSGVVPVGHSMPVASLSGIGMPFLPVTPSTDHLSSGKGYPASSGDAKHVPHIKGVRKYTCRFLINIDNDKDFGVVRRIIGAKGANMKRINKVTDAKLRLRGKGSGYFEGASQRESTEPLQLCVSCTSGDGYKSAVSLTEELLEQIYVDYRIFCQEEGRPEPDLHASAQVVSGRERGSGEVASSGSSGPVSPAPAMMPADDEGSDDGGDEDTPEEGALDEAHANGKKEAGSRRRGRRSRGGKSRTEGSNKVFTGDRNDPPPEAPAVEEIEHFIEQRNEARRQCNFSEADRIRLTLHESGVALMDEPGARGKGGEVTTWRYWRE